MKKTIKCIVVLVAILTVVTTFMPNKQVSAYQWNGIYSNSVYNIKNKASGKYLNVNLGKDANGTNVNQWTKDGSIEQQWRVLDWSGSRLDVSVLYPMCSSNGYGRVLDILRTGGSSSGEIKAGCNVDIWAEGDDEAQLWIIQPRGNGYFSIDVSGLVPGDLCLTVNGTSNGSGAGTSSTSKGNVYVDNFTGADNQLWSFEWLYNL